MLDRNIGLTGPEPEKAAQIPAAGEARVECQRTIDQPDHRTDILAEISQHGSRIGESTRVVLPHLERQPREVDAPSAGCLRLFYPTGSDDLQVADCRPRE